MPIEPGFKLYSSAFGSHRLVSNAGPKLKGGSELDVTELDLKILACSRRMGPNTAAQLAFDGLNDLADVEPLGVRALKPSLPVGPDAVAYDGRSISANDPCLRAWKGPSSVEAPMRDAPADPGEP